MTEDCSHGWLLLIFRNKRLISVVTSWINLQYPVIFWAVPINVNCHSSRKMAFMNVSKYQNSNSLWIFQIWSWHQKFPEINFDGHFYPPELLKGKEEKKCKTISKMTLLSLNWQPIQAGQFLPSLQYLTRSWEVKNQGSFTDVYDEFLYSNLMTSFSYNIIICIKQHYKRTSNKHL